MSDPTPNDDEIPVEIEKPKGETPAEKEAAARDEPTDVPKREAETPALKTGKPPEATAAEEDETIESGSLRVDPDVGLGAAMFDQTFSTIWTSGPAMFGNHNTFVANAGPQDPDPIVSPLGHVVDLVELYVPSDADKPLGDLLADRSTGCLVGPKNSGRFSTACMALAKHFDAKRVYEISLPAGVAPDVLVRKPGDLANDSGYVMRLSSGNHVDVVRKLAGLFHDRSSALLLIKDEESRGPERHGAEVRHQQPRSVEVFRKHLEYRLRRKSEPPADLSAAVASYEVDDIQAALRNANGPKECVALAVAIAEAHPVRGDELEKILVRSQSRRRERAQRILLPTGDAFTAGGHRAGQHERAFRLAYAVFREQPMHYVFEAAELLLNEIDSAALRPGAGRVALHNSVVALLGDELIQDWQEGREASIAVRGAARVAWIRDDGLSGAILDVAWHDFDGTRGPLLAWLSRLAGDDDETLRRAAAKTAGILAHYDFDRLHRNLIDDWASSPSPRVRQAAAWTETISHLAGDVAQLVREKVSDWCARGNKYQHDTAARVYASGLEQPVLAWSMFDLSRIAEDRLQLGSHVIAEGVNQLYQPDRAGWLVTELAVWANRPRVQVHAARALLKLAWRSTDVTQGGPDLLLRLEADEVAVTELAAIWRIALVGESTSEHAGRTLREWIRSAELEPRLRPPLVDLLSAIEDRPVMHRRVNFLLRERPGWLL